ncbi:hypothetical protein [Burkholderia lata]|nr:hypothetical protein [Burkholderia lata]
MFGDLVFALSHQQPSLYRGNIASEWVNTLQLLAQLIDDHGGL